jgi:hypothetical protein
MGCAYDGNVGGERFGRSVVVSRDGSTAIVGTPKNGNFRGGARIFVNNGTTWIQQGPPIRGSNAFRCEGDYDLLEGAAQGWSVDLSYEGDTALLGGPWDNCTGAVWVFERSGSKWFERAKLTVDHFPMFGWSAALSADGNTALIGAYKAAWVFRKRNEVWTRLEPKLFVGLRAKFGFAVALSADGKSAFVGAPFDGGNGSVWIFSV